jgi:hypothetical protein
VGVGARPGVEGGANCVSLQKNKKTDKQTKRQKNKKTERQKNRKTRTDFDLANDYCRFAHERVACYLWNGKIKITEIW